MRFGRSSKKALKWYAGWKGFKGMAKVAALAASGMGAYKLYQSRKPAT